MANTKEDVLISAREAKALTDKAISNTDADWLAHVKKELSALIKAEAARKSTSAHWTYTEEGTQRLVLLTDLLVSKDFRVDVPRHLTPRATVIKISWRHVNLRAQRTK